MKVVVTSALLDMICFSNPLQRRRLPMQEGDWGVHLRGAHPPTDRTPPSAVSCERVVSVVFLCSALYCTLSTVRGRGVVFLHRSENVAVGLEPHVLKTGYSNVKCCCCYRVTSSIPGSLHVNRPCVPVTNATKASRSGFI